MTRVHDLHIRLDDSEWEAVRSVAGRVRMPVSAAVRLLVLRGLDREAVEPSTASRRKQGDGGYLDDLTLAALLAAEHAILLLADMTPGGAERAARLGERAAAAAQRRLVSLAAGARPEEIS